MIISIIAALAENNVIGKDNTLPWGRIPLDMRHFIDLTKGKPVIMGTKTYLSLGNPLKNRVNIVLGNTNVIGDVVRVHSIDEAMKEAEKTESKEVMIIGGASVYRQFMDVADRMYITYIEGIFPGDTFFPEIDERFWSESSSKDHKKDKENKYNLRFVTLERIKRS